MNEVNGAKIGATVGAVGGLLFLVINAGVFDAPWPSVVRLAAVAGFAGVVSLVRRARYRGDPPGRAQLRGFWITVVLEFLAIFAGANLFVRVLDQPDASLPWVSLVLGVHWLVFYRIFRQTVFLWLGVLVTGCGVVGLVWAFVVSDATRATTIVSGLLTGVILLLAVGVDAAASRRPVRTS